MKVTKISQTGDRMIRGYIMANPKTGEVEVHFVDGQNLGKRCSSMMEKIAPEAGTTGHRHQDWNQGGPPDDLDRVREYQKEHA